jgi:type II secretory ATPase GspE/PulE/Tfp pilus assembly ATPase PilB-like protein
VLVKIATKKPKFETLDDLGMRPAMRERFKELIDESKGFVIVSAPPGEGVSTLWRIALTTADRYVRDFVSIEDKRQPEEDVVNVGPVFFDGAEGQKTADVLPRLFLKMPDVFVVPDLGDGRAVEMLCDQVNSQNKLVIVRVAAKEASEALLRVMAYKGPLREFAQAVTLVLSGRLVRKLCEPCRQSYQPSPQLLQKLGIPPGRASVLYRDFQPPPPEQRVDAKGKPIEIEICEQCGGLGFFGRTGIFEMMVINDVIREALVKTPSLEGIRRAAHMSGHHAMQEEGIVLVAQGTTSLQELQRVLKQ